MYVYNTAYDDSNMGGASAGQQSPHMQWNARERQRDRDGNDDNEMGWVSLNQ